MRSRLVSAVVMALLLPALAASTAYAYKLGGRKWPTRTITYHSSAKQYKAAIEEAVRQWNQSGARIRFKATSRRKAKLRIVYGATVGPSGSATLGWAPDDAVYKVWGAAMYNGPAPCGSRLTIPGMGTKRIKCYGARRVVLDRVKKAELKDPAIRAQMAVVAAHELGHTLGLKHVGDRCSVMNYQRRKDCPKPPPDPWQARCRLVELDDARGAVARYGGKVRSLAPEFCDVYTPIAAPADLAATWDDGSVQLTWTNPADARLTRYSFALKHGSCVTEPYYWIATSPGAPEVQSASAWTEGRWCATVWPGTEDGETGRPASVWFDVPPSSDGP